MSRTLQLTRSTSRGSDFELAYASPITIVAKGADRRSIERHDSKKHRPRGLSDEQGKIGHDGRKRRYRGSSDDEGNTTEDGFSNEDLRVGGPYLCSIPHATTLIPREDPIFLLLARECSDGKMIINHIVSILNSANIQTYSEWARGESISLCLRQSEFKPEPYPIPTIVIEATRGAVNDTWLSAARKIHSLLREEGFAFISVEITDPQANYPPLTSPVEPDEKIYSKWNSVLERILQVVDLRGVSSIGCYRRGRSPQVSENAPTILMIVDSDLESNNLEWKVTREAVTNILAEFRLPMVAVEIMKDKIHRLHRQKGFSEEILSGRAVPGGPLAALKNQNGSGTIGGFIELQDPIKGDWLKFALTCFHVVDIDDEDAVTEDDLDVIKGWRKNGFPIRDYKTRESKTTVLLRNFRVSYPSLLARGEQDDISSDVLETFKKSSIYEQGMMLREHGLLNELSEYKKERHRSMQEKIHKHEAHLKRIAKFFEDGKNVFGTVASGSGYRQIERHTLGKERHPTQFDWALVRIDDHWSVSNKIDEDTSLCRLASEESLRDLNDSFGDERLLRFQGYRSGRREVLYNSLVSVIIETKFVKDEIQEIFRLEYSVCRSDNEYEPVAMYGDSGSLLFRKVSKDVVGMLYAGHKQNKIAYITRMDDLQDDILKITGGKGPMRMYQG